MPEPKEPNHFKLAFAAAPGTVGDDGRLIVGWGIGEFGDVASPIYSTPEVPVPLFAA